MDAGYPGLWVSSYEHEEAIEEIQEATANAYPMFFVWDGADGLKQFIVAGDERPGWAPIQNTLTPEAALTYLATANLEPGEGEPHRAVIVFKNLDFYLNPPRDQIVLNYLHRAEREYRQRIVVLSMEEEVPKHLHKAFQPLTHELPNHEQLQEILNETAETEGDLPEDPVEVSAIIDAAKGLTRRQARNAFCLGIVTEQQVSARQVFEEKAAAFEKSGLGLELNRDTMTFENIGGLSYLKQFYLEMMSKPFNPDITRNGIILAGVPGTGKSLFSETAGNSSSPMRPAMRWQAALSISKYVGESGHNLNAVLRIADTCAPVILEIDEAEKAFADFTSDNESGGSSSGQQMMSLWLPWHQMHRTDVYPILTMNDIIPLARKRPEFLARFDEVFFIDAPERAQKDAIWKIHMLRVGLIEDPEEYDDIYKAGDIPDDRDWVGRDIQKVCNQSVLRGVPVGTIKVGTMSGQAKESLDAMREFAKGRWMSAEFPGYYGEEPRRSLPVQGAARDTVRRKKVAKKKDARPYLPNV